MTNTTFADEMRTWMRTWTIEKKKPFSAGDIFDGLAVPPEKKSRVYYALKNAVRRGEIKHIEKRKYTFNRDWHPQKTGRASTLKPKVVKALYISGDAVTIPDIQRLTGIQSARYCGWVVYALVAAGYVERVKRGAFRVTDRDRFRIEVIK